MRRVLKRKSAVAALAVLVLVSATAILAPLIAPFDPLEGNLDDARMSPTRTHLFGTDEQGRDVLSRVLFGARVSLLIAIAATVLATLIGCAAGLVGGYVGGKVDMAVVAISDLTLAFPSLLLAIAITAVMGGGFHSVFLALALVGWATIARMVRGLVISLRESEYIMAARAAGCGHLRIVIRHILPNALPLIVVVTSLRVGAFVLGESSLSFLGLGLKPPTPTWGSMISLGRDYLHSAPWMTVFPGAAIAITILAFNVVGDALRDEIDPRLKL